MPVLVNTIFDAIHPISTRYKIFKGGIFLIELQPDKQTLGITFPPKVIPYIYLDLFTLICTLFSFYRNA